MRHFKIPVFVRSAILMGLLPESRDLRELREFLESVGLSYQRGSLYPALRALEAEQLIRRAEEFRDASPTEGAYSLTLEGERAALAEREVLTEFVLNTRPSQAEPRRRRQARPTAQVGG